MLLEVITMLLCANLNARDIAKLAQLCFSFLFTWSELKPFDVVRLVAFTGKNIVTFSTL